MAAYLKNVDDVASSFLSPSAGLGALLAATPQPTNEAKAEVQPDAPIPKPLVAAAKPCGSSAKVAEARATLSEALLLPPWADSLHCASTPEDATAAVSSSLHTLMDTLVWQDVARMAHAAAPANSGNSSGSAAATRGADTATAATCADPAAAAEARNPNEALLLLPSTLVDSPVPTNTAAPPEAVLESAADMPCPMSNELQQLERAYRTAAAADLSDLHRVVAAVMEGSVTTLPPRTVSLLSQLVESYAGASPLTVMVLCVVAFGDQISSV